MGLARFAFCLVDYFRIFAHGKIKSKCTIK
jgi:hypothetical protein